MHKTLYSYIKIGLFTTLFVIIDQISKYLATIHLRGKNDVQIIKNVLCLHYLDGGNSGAAWGMLSGKRILFILFTVLAVIIIFFFINNIQKIRINYSLKNKRLILLQYSFGLLTAGAFGNLIDRVFHGYVTDFIYFELIDFPIFNVADCYVTISCIFILIICFFRLKEDEFNRIFTLKK